MIASFSTHDDTVANDPAVALGLLKVVPVLDPHLAADPGIQVDDRVLDQAALADADRWSPRRTSGG